MGMNTLSRYVGNRNAMLGTSAAIMITAGSGCGFDCRQERDMKTRDEMLQTTNELLAFWLKQCGDNQDCQNAVRETHLQIHAKIMDWYMERASNDFRPTQETRDTLDRIRELLRDFLGTPLLDKLIGYTGSVSGNGELVLVTAVPIDEQSISLHSQPHELELRGVQITKTTSVAALAAVSEAANTSSTGTIPAQQISVFRGSFTLSITTGASFQPGDYRFEYSFVTGRSKTLNGLTVRTLTSGLASIQGTPLVIELDPESGNSRLIVGANGRGVLRISGRMISSDPNVDLPFNIPLSFDLPIESSPLGGFVIQSDPDVDLNIMVNTQAAWFVDYDGNGQIEPADRSLFLADHAAEHAWTDLNADGVFDALDIALFDDATSRALARLAYLAAQGVNE